MRNKKVWVAGVLSLLLVLAGSLALAKVSPEEADRLNKDLTPFGAERAGNTDGTIPAWSGGIKEIPAGINYQAGDFYQDIFADDKVLYSITAKNIDQYADKLSEGQKALFKKYPDTYKVNVYQTRRTQSAPNWVYENTFKNATRASITDDGLGVVGGHGGIPFPIPKRAEEVITNHNMRWNAVEQTVEYEGGIRYPERYDVVTGGRFDFYNVYYQKDVSNEKDKGDLMWFMSEYQRPARRKGEFVLVKDPINQSEKARKAWQYLPGQRRVRRAPTLAYDNPSTGVSGHNTMDDAYMFNGALDRYDWKLIGKKEMYIPYNNYKFDLASRDEVVTPYHLNPEYVRWELHRVWVVEATLKKGKRHVYAKRTFYLDEDTWNVDLVDNYDQHGKLWRTAYAMSYNHYNILGVLQRSYSFTDLLTDVYVPNVMVNGLPQGPRPRIEKTLSSDYFTPENLRSKGRR